MSAPVLNWFDTHVHWSAAEFAPDRDNALERAYAAGVRYCLNPSVSVDDILKVHALAELSTHQNYWPKIFPAYGIHPLYVDQSKPDDLQQLDQWLRTQRPAAIGEIGLDAYPGAPDIDRQRQLFEAQLDLAVTHQLPVLLHVRHAVELVIQSIKRVQARSNKIPGGIAHAFNGSRAQADQLIGMGFLLGFGGSCTYEGSTRIRSLVAQLPLQALVLETDAPDMAPVWLRGKRNETNQLPLIAQTIAALRGISLAEISEASTANALQLLASRENDASA